MINESQKWPTNKGQHDVNYLRAFGAPAGKEICSACEGRGYHEDKPSMMKKKVRTTCIICGGTGLVKKETEREKHEKVD